MHGSGDDSAKNSSSLASLVNAPEESAEEIRMEIPYGMLAHFFCAHGARDRRCRLFEQICCDSRIDELSFGMA